MIDDRIKEVKQVIAQLSAELAVLEGQSGKAAEFIKQARSDGSLPAEVRDADIALIIDLWEKSKSMTVKTATKG